MFFQNNNVHLDFCWVMTVYVFCILDSHAVILSKKKKKKSNMVNIPNLALERAWHLSKSTKSFLPPHPWWEDPLRFKSSR